MKEKITAAKATAAIKKAAKERKNTAKEIRENCEKRYTLSAGFDPCLGTELVANLKEKGYVPTYVAESWLVFNDKDHTLTKEQVEEVKEICRNTKFEYKKTKTLKDNKTKVSVVRTLKVLWVNAYRAFKFEGETVKDTLNEKKTVKKVRNKKPTNNTLEKKVAARTRRKTANKENHVKFEKRKENYERKRKAITNRGKHSSGTNRTNTERKIAKRVSLALKHIAAQAA